LSQPAPFVFTFLLHKNFLDYVLGMQIILLRCDSKIDCVKVPNRDTILVTCYDFGRQWACFSDV